MKLADQPSKVNGVHVMEIQIDAMHPNVQRMNANYALVVAVKREPEEDSAQFDTDKYTIETHGKCSAYPSNWSARTVELLREMIKSMEEDLLPRHFDIESQEGTDERTADRGEEGPAQV